MFSASFFFAVAVFTVTNAIHVERFDLVEEALAQVEQLKTIVQGEILAAHNDINDLTTSFEINSVNVANGAAINLEQEHDTCMQQLTTMKDLAQSAGKIPGLCTASAETTLNRLPVEYNEEITSCIAKVDDEVKKLSESSKYIVDITFNTVSHLEFQITQCRGELLCISPLLNEIELNKIRLVQNVKTEIQAFDGLAATLKVSVESCSNDNVSRYVIQYSTMLKSISVCLSKIPVFPPRVL